MMLHYLQVARLVTRAFRRSVVVSVPVSQQTSDCCAITNRVHRSIGPEKDDILDRRAVCTAVSHESKIPGQVKLM